jgi:hypothetical protein
MSLDSVELIIELEKYFQLQFPDAEIEKVVTIQDCTDLVARKLGITDASAPLRERIGARVQEVLQAMGLSASPVPWDDAIFKRLHPEDPMRWEQFCTRMALVIPKPHLGGEKPQRSLFGPIVDYIWHVSHDWRALTLDQLVTAICVANHKQLIDPRQMTTAFEAYVGVVAVTIACLGLDVYEIEAHKSFANDLGVD